MAVLLRRTEVHMDTPVTVGVVVRDPATGCSAALRRAFGRFREVEAHCSCSDPGSEVSRLAERPEVPVEVSPILFAAVEFACAVARRSGGAFDPTVVPAQETRHRGRHRRTGRAEPWRETEDSGGADWSDVVLDARRRTITLRRPLLLDLGAVAKGLAVDMAAGELTGFPGCVVEAGGDLLVRGGNSAGEPWRIGIRHPQRPDDLCTVVHLRRGAVCTSGDHQRLSPRRGGTHLLDQRTGRPPSTVAICTVVASTAMQADALSTAACVLGPRRGVPWLQRQGVEGLMLMAPGLKRFETRGFARYEPCPA